MKLNLQYFAEEVSKTEETGAQVEAVEEQPAKEEKMYTQSEVNEIMRKRMDRAMREQQEKIDAAKSEATKMAKMNAEQKRNYELEKANKRAQDAEARLARLEMQTVARKMFDESGVAITDEELALVVTDDAETTKSNVEMLTEFAKKVREKAVNEVMAGSTPKDVGVLKPAKSVSNIDELSMREIAQLKKDDPEQFKVLTGGK
ncbi:DUF4355 domain-containing protein [Ligilactobacillus murinus]|nr:DUF4355 domain-containing protein [Ligilactobacillus murinus]